MKNILASLLLLAAAGPLLAQSDPASEAQAKLDRSRTEALLEQLDCHEKKARLLYEIVSLSTGPLRNYKFRCAAGKENISTPPWLDAELSSAAALRLPVDKDTVAVTALWGEPLLALGDLAELLRKAEPRGGGYGLEPRYLAPAAGAVLQRYDKALARLRKSRQAGAFGGRGDAVFSALVRSLYAFDELERNFSGLTQVGFYEKAAAALRGGEEAFAALLGEASGRASDGPRAFSAEYRLKPRLLPGQRAVSVPLPWWQLEHLKAGDSVDLLVTYENAGAQGARETITATLLQNARVLGASKPAEPGGRGTLRLLLTALEAQYAALAQVQGRELAVSLRAEGDAEARPMDVANLKKVVK